MPNIERTGWRDLELSNRHRLWGVDCPAVDLDFVMLEFNHGMAAAIVEYKHFLAPMVRPDEMRYRALIDLADNHNPPIPLIVAYYYKNPWSFLVQPMNATAEFFITKEHMSERDFVKTLHKIRNERINEKVLSILDDIIPTGLERLACGLCDARTGPATM